MMIDDDNKATIHTCCSFVTQELRFVHYRSRRLLSTGPRLLCWVLTMPATHDTKARAVAKTWGPS